MYRSMTVYFFQWIGVSETMVNQKKSLAISYIGFKSNDRYLLKYGIIFLELTTPLLMGKLIVN